MIHVSFFHSQCFEYVDFSTFVNVAKIEIIFPKLIFFHETPIKNRFSLQFDQISIRKYQNSAQVDSRIVVSIPLPPFRQLFRPSYLIGLQINARAAATRRINFSPSSEGTRAILCPRVLSARWCSSCRHKDRAESIRAGNKPISLWSSLIWYPYCADFSKGILRLVTLMCIFKPLSGKRSMEQNSLQINRNGIFP